MANIYQSLLIAGATKEELARQLKYLKVENQILMSRCGNVIQVTPLLHETLRTVSDIPAGRHPLSTRVTAIIKVFSLYFII